MPFTLEQAIYGIIRNLAIHNATLTKQPFLEELKTLEKAF